MKKKRIENFLQKIMAYFPTNTYHKFYRKIAVIEPVLVEL